MPLIQYIFSDMTTAGQCTGRWAGPALFGSACLGPSPSSFSTPGAEGTTGACGGDQGPPTPIFLEGRDGAGIAGGGKKLKGECHCG